MREADTAASSSGSSAEADSQTSGASTNGVQHSLSNNGSEPRAQAPPVVSTNGTEYASGSYYQTSAEERAER